MKDVKRKQLRRAILKLMYDHLLSDAGGWVRIDKEDLDAFDWKDVKYEWRRLAGDGYLEGDDFRRITARGMEFLSDGGVATVLDNDLREATLGELYDVDRKHGGHGWPSGEEIAASLGKNARDVQAVLHYLEDSGLIEARGAMGERFTGVRATSRGLSRYEAIEAGGSWGGSTTSPNDGHEFVFGPREEQEAERLLRDIVEVSQSEVLIVDPWARAGIVRRLSHVPRGVKVKVLTSDLMANEDYRAQLAMLPDLELEIRALPKADLGFHNRYVIVDREDAWDWGHSFHDAGATKHTVAQLRPVNRDQIARDFDSRWSTALAIL